MWSVSTPYGSAVEFNGIDVRPLRGAGNTPAGCGKRLSLAEASATMCR
jgi:hypothetical protein